MFIDFPEVSIPVQGLDQVKLPAMYAVKQHYDSRHIADIPGHVRERMERLKHREKYRGKRLCITVGSRGIPHMDLLLGTVCAVLKEWGASPFIIPAMGSHGGATAEGQAELIASYNITEKSMGVPVLSSMEAVRYGELADGTPLYCDKYAWESDGMVIFNKVKPHTDFRGRHESGLAKMIAIGLGKHKGASAFHLRGFGAFAETIPRAAEVFLGKAPVAFGLGLVQNAYDEICNIDFCEAGDILKLDADLLEIAKDRIPVFKFKDLDVLVVDQIGKNISGNGHDPNIIGRNNSGDFPEVLRLRRLFIRGLTAETHHNACGINLADITTRRCLNDIDWVSTWINIITANRLNGGRIPMYVNTDREALLLAIRTCDGIDFDRPRVARIRSTLEMGHIWVSEAVYAEIKDREDVSFVRGPFVFDFDSDGFMRDMPA
jgi:hypothetical protein